MAIFDNRAAITTNERMNDVGPSERDKIWRSEASVAAEETGILSFIFANVEQYDEERPVS